MREYIKTQPNSEENLADMEMVIEIAEAKNSKSPVAKRKRLSIKDIADQPFILTERGMGYRKFFDKGIAEKSIDITPVLEIDRTDIITKLLEEKEECISYLPSFVVGKIFQCYKEN